MNRGRGRGRGGKTGGHSNPRGAANLAHRRSPVGADRSREVPLGGEDGLSVSEKKNLRQMSVAGVSKHSEHKPKLGTTFQQKWLPRGSKDGFSNVRSCQQGINSPDGVGSESKEPKCLVTLDSTYERDFPPLSVHPRSGGLDGGTSQIEQIVVGRSADLNTESHDFSENLTIFGQQGGTQLPARSAKSDEPSPNKDPKSSAGHSNSWYSGDLVLDPFDICHPRAGAFVVLQPPLLVKNRERRKETQRSVEGPKGIVLRSGMVLLKSYICLNDQINIVKICRDLGLGPGGFYQPGYRGGAKLRLRMMCLGKNWDPETRKYGYERPFDGAKPPNIPPEFKLLVKKAINDSHPIIQKNSKASSVENILPRMIPDICLVNFYSANGRLGLHQDCDESNESLDKGLPVVSFSIGDAADFLYGDQRDVDKAEKVVLESGDILIFGGKSRHVFHGVTSIHPNTAPKALLEEANLRSGRLNLTFREY